MKDQLISFKTALLAKEKGIPVLYEEEKPYHIIPYTQSLLQKWIRETHSLDIIITSNLIGYAYLIYQRYPPKNILNKNVYKTYEEALEAGLIESLKLNYDR